MGFLYFIGIFIHTYTKTQSAMAPKKMKAEFSVRTQQFQVNKLLNRKQFAVVINHPTWNDTVPKTKIIEKLTSLYKVPDQNQVSVFGLKTKFGGGKTVGFGFIYDDVASMKRIEPNYRLIRYGMSQLKRNTARKTLKEKRHHNAKLRGTAKGGKKK